MKPFWRHSIAAIALLCCANALAVPYPTADQFRTAIEDVAGLAKSEGLEVEILDAQVEGVTQNLMAAGLSLTSGVCMVFYNTVPLKQLSPFFNSVQEQDLSIWLHIFAVHELTHCFEQREAYIRKHFDKVLPPGVQLRETSIQGYLSEVKSGAVEKWGEALADIAAVLYLKQAVPGRWEHFANGLADMRSELSGAFPSHDTTTWLRRVIAADVEKPEGQSVFEAAFKLRTQYRPEE
jgi:hypothetical protein